MSSDSDSQTGNCRGGGIGRRRRKPRPKLQHDGQLYTFEKEKNGTKYFRCKERKSCSSRIIVGVDNEYKVTRPHTCIVPSYERAKDAAIERLRELTFSVEGSVKAIDLVRRVLKDLSPEVRALMPKEDSLIHRVRRWARSGNIQLVKTTPEDYLIPEGEEPLAGYSGIPANSSDPSSSITPAIPRVTSESVNASSSGIIKTGVVDTEPVGELGEFEDRKPGGLIYLKGRVKGHNTAMIEGQSYYWKRDMTDGKVMYACQKAQIGCPVIVTVDNIQKKYELRGNHVHNRVARGNKTGRMNSLKRVDEDGNEIGVATLEDFISGITDFVEDGDGDDELEQSYTQSQTSQQVDNDDGNDDNDYNDHGGDDFQMDFEPEPEPVTVKPQPRALSQTQSSFVVTTSSNPPPRPAKRLPKDAVKSGERCFVCGDELIVSETLSASEETFRKACCYLNVKSEGEWFPRASNARFYSFCESCTNEVIRIHSLYKKVEEIQSLIFKKVESVEKRIADAEIVDNWMAEAPHSTALRFEGFRKQVLINYRNKLKLRREIRFGKKTGQPLVEIQPGPTAHMFAKDPCENDAFCNPSSVTTDVSDNPSKITTDNVTDAVPAPPRRTRGRPKSKKPVEEREEITTETVTTPAPESPLIEDPVMDQDTNFDDDSFQNDFDDSQDAASVVSEKEVKFWEQDASLLDVPRSSERRAKNNVSFEDDGDSDDEHEHAEDGNESDPDYQEDGDEDEDWGPKKKRAKNTRWRKGLGSGKTKDHGWFSMQSEAPSAPRRIILEDKRPQKKVEPYKPKSKRIKSSHSYNIKFPDAVLTKDGRVFMEGIEIIKNPAGVYKPRPYSTSFSCGACGAISPGFWKIRQHICGHHLGMYKCHICQKEFADGRIIQRHIAMTHGHATYEDCPDCGKPVKIYKNEKSVLRHRWSHLSEEEKQDPQYKSWCPPFKDPDRVKRRKSGQTFMCEQCGKSFRLQGALRKHEMTHAPDYELNLMCQYCGKTFNLRKRLSQHVYTCAKKAQGDINITTYPCPKCPTRFSTRATRSKHMRRFHLTGTVELPFSCPKCPRKFSTRTGFRTHKRVCIDGEKGNNNKRGKKKSQPSTSSAANDGHSEFKTDTSSSTMGHSQVDQDGGSQYDMNSSSTALGFSYNFM